MTIRDQIAAETDPEKRKQLKASLLLDAFAQGATKTFTRGPYSVTISDLKLIPPKTVEFNVTVLQNGIDVTPVNLNPVRIVNPPMMIPDPTGEVIQVIPNKATPASAPVDITRQLTEAPGRALLQTLRELLNIP